MALIKCKECNAEISTDAETCPHCGARVAGKSAGCGTIIVGALVVIVVIAAVIGFSAISTYKSYTASNSAAQSSPSSAAPTAPPPAPGSQWAYSQDPDPMGKGATYYARVSSTNTVEFDFPYAGTQRGNLFLRTHPRYGKDVIFQIERGQILCRSYQSCNVLIRFDNEEPSTFSAIGPSDGSSETILIRNYSRFTEKMFKAKQVRLAVNIYKQGAPVFEFDVSDFDKNKYIPKDNTAVKQKQDKK